jgi:DNA uptake protein ComE-like DNA-binding protein
VASGDKSSNLFHLTRSQRRGIWLLLPLLAIVAAIIVTAGRPSFEQSFLELADMGQTGAPKSVQKSSAYPDTAASDTTAELFAFDPNTVSLQELCRLGFDSRTAAGIIKYRTKGKRFEIAEDFATCYGVSMEQYTRLEPYIRIGAQYAAARRAYPQRTAANTGREEIALADFDPNALDTEGFVDMGFSEAQARVIIKYRTSMGGFKSADDFARCYVVSEEMNALLAPYIKIVAPEEVAAPAISFPIEINRADSATLRAVSGIGEVLVGRIMEYRARLGGFARIEQLSEIQGMVEANYERIVQQISVDSCVIKKIDINFATHKTVAEQLGKHPYMTPKVLRKILKQRQLKGGWSTIGDMVDENILTREQAERLAPYFLFTARE